MPTYSWRNSKGMCNWHSVWALAWRWIAFAKSPALPCKNMGTFSQSLDHSSSYKMKLRECRYCYQPKMDVWWEGCARLLISDSTWNPQGFGARQSTKLLLVSFRPAKWVQSLVAFATPTCLLLISGTQKQSFITRVSYRRVAKNYTTASAW